MAAGGPRTATRSTANATQGEIQAWLAALPPVREGPFRYLAAGQVEALADAAGPGRVAYCGLRWSELAALRVGQVDLLRRRLTIEEAATEICSKTI